MKIRTLLRLVPVGLIIAVASMASGCGPMVYDSNPHFSHHRNHKKPPKPPTPPKHNVKPPTPPKNDKPHNDNGHRDRH